MEKKELIDTINGITNGEQVEIEIPMDSGPVLVKGIAHVDEKTGDIRLLTPEGERVCGSIDIPGVGQVDINSAIIRRGQGLTEEDDVKISVQGSKGILGASADLKLNMRDNMLDITNFKAGFIPLGDQHFPVDFSQLRIQAGKQEQFKGEMTQNYQEQLSTMGYNQEMLKQIMANDNSLDERQGRHL